MASDEKRLLRLFRGLSERGRASVLDYVEFIHARDEETKATAPSPVPLDIPRPAQESVVKAIKRLMMTYPMLERDRLFHETSALMTRHVMQQRPAAEVIDELEAVFKRHYDSHLEIDGGRSSSQQPIDGAS